MLEREVVIKAAGKRGFVKVAYKFGGIGCMKKILGMNVATIGSAVIILSTILKVKKQISMPVIGGTDGPTSIFLAGKVGSASVVTGMIVGIVLLATGIFMVVRKK